MSVKSKESLAIRKVVDQTKLIDTHEHLQRENNRIHLDVDVLSIFFLQYASSDVEAIFQDLGQL